MAVIERWPLNRGFLSTILKGDAVGTNASGHYRESGRLSGVAVKRGSTVHVYRTIDKGHQFPDPGLGVFCCLMA